MILGQIEVIFVDSAKLKKKIDDLYKLSKKITKIKRSDKNEFLDGKHLK